MEKLARSEAEGKAKGKAEGKAEGEAEGEARGKAEQLVTLICKKKKLGQSLEKIAEDLVEEISVIEPIFTAAEKFAPTYEPEAVLQSMAGETVKSAAEEAGQPE